MIDKPIQQSPSAKRVQIPNTSWVDTRMRMAIDEREGRGPSRVSIVGRLISGRVR